VQCPKCNSTEVHTEERGWTWLTGFFRSGQMLLTCRSCLCWFTKLLWSAGSGSSL